MTTQRMSSLLMAFIVLGTLTAMVTTPDPEWWTVHFSQLGTFDDLSSWIFNGTLIAGGLLVTTFAVYIANDMQALVDAGRLSNQRLAAHRLDAVRRHGHHARGRRHLPGRRQPAAPQPVGLGHGDRCSWCCSSAARDSSAGCRAPTSCRRGRSSARWSRRSSLFVVDVLLAHRVRDHRVRADLRLDRGVHPLPRRRRSEGLTGDAISPGRRGSSDALRQAQRPAPRMLPRAQRPRLSPTSTGSASDSRLRLELGDRLFDRLGTGLGGFRPRTPARTPRPTRRPRAQRPTLRQAQRPAPTQWPARLGRRRDSADSSPIGTSMSGSSSSSGTATARRAHRLRARDARGAISAAAGRSGGGADERRLRLASSRRHPSSRPSGRRGAPSRPRRGCRASAARAASARSTRSRPPITTIASGCEMKPP